MSDADHERVNRAVRDAESTTSAEILPVVVRSSGRYDRPEDVVGLCLAAVAVSVVWLLFPAPSGEPGDWGGISPAWQLAGLLAALLAGFVGGAFLASRVDWLRRLFTPGDQMRDEVYRRAREIFFDQRVHHTLGKGGVLLYVSLFEHRAAVIADRGIVDKLGQPRIDELCREFTRRLHERPLVDALCETIESAGKILAPHLPRAADDANELSDALVVID
jgi:putative membrane protein